MEADSRRMMEVEGHLGRLEAATVDQSWRQANKITWGGTLPPKISTSLTHPTSSLHRHSLPLSHSGLPWWSTIHPEPTLMRLKSVFRRVTRKLAAMNATFRFALLELPTELIAQIIEHVDNRTTLKHLACTCRKIQELTEPVLYRSALIRDAVQMTNMLHSVVGNRPARAKAIHHLDVPCHPRSSPSFDDLGVLLENALNLRRLMVESPECNTGEFEDEDSYEYMARNLFRPFESAVCVNDVERRPLQRLQERKSVPDKRREDCLASPAPPLSL